MLFLTSPSKTMTIPGPLGTRLPGEDRLEKALEIRESLRNMNQEELMKLYGASEEVASKAMELLRVDESYRVLPAFSGQVFQVLDYPSLEKKERDYIDQHVIILSALYGYLRPDEGFYPYRLDLVDDLDIDLIKIWKPVVTATLEKEPLIVDLASKEYMRLVDKKTLKKTLVTVDFKEIKKDKLRTVGVYAKKARGAFMRYAATIQARTLEDLRSFDGMGYTLDPERSTERHLVFVR